MARPPRRGLYFNTTISAPQQLLRVAVVLFYLVKRGESERREEGYKPSSRGEGRGPRGDRDLGIGISNVTDREIVAIAGECLEKEGAVALYSCFQASKMLQLPTNSHNHTTVVFVNQGHLFSLLQPPE